MKTRISSILSALIAILLPIIGGRIVAFVTSRDVNTWYSALRKPSWNPPNWLFGPVWTILYGLMGLASWLVWRKRGEQEKEVHNALNWYGRQLGLNFLWSLIFFGLHRPELALLEMFPLIGSSLNTIAKFSTVDRLAAGLMIPYQLWVAFAAVLNVAIWLLNPNRSRYL